MKNYEQFVNEGKAWDAIVSLLKSFRKKLFKSDPEGLESKERQKITDVLGKNPEEPKQVFLSDILGTRKQEPKQEIVKRPYTQSQEDGDDVESYEEYKARKVKEYMDAKKEREAERKIDDARWELPKKEPREIETEEEIKAKEEPKEDFSKNQEEIKAQLIDIGAKIYTDFLKSKTFKHFTFKKDGDVNQLEYRFSEGNNKIYFEFVKDSNTSILIYTKNNYIITYKLNADFTDNFITAFIAILKIQNETFDKVTKKIDINRNNDNDRFYK